MFSAFLAGAYKNRICSRSFRVGLIRTFGHLSCEKRARDTSSGDDPLRLSNRANGAAADRIAPAPRRPEFAERRALSAWATTNRSMALISGASGLE